MVNGALLIRMISLLSITLSLTCQELQAKSSFTIKIKTLLHFLSLKLCFKMNHSSKKDDPKKVHLLEANSVKKEKSTDPKKVESKVVTYVG